MSRLVSSLAVYTLAICSASSTSSYDETWRQQFRSKINVLPKPEGECSVCFYEQPNFSGPKFCVGKSATSCTKANPIAAPGTIGSIKFGKSCELVVNVRVTDVPFDEHIAVISTDVATFKYYVQEFYVEEAGQACFLGVPNSGIGYGVCYTDNVPVVEEDYRNSFTELMLFNTDKKDYDVIAYENDYYNGPTNNVGLEQRFSGYSKSLETNEINPISGMNKTLQNKVRSVKFVFENAGFVVPAAY